MGMRDMEWGQPPMDPVDVSNEWRKLKGDGPAVAPIQPRGPDDRGLGPSVGSQTNMRLMGDIMDIMMDARSVRKDDIVGRIKSRYPNITDEELDSYVTQAGRQLRRNYEGGDPEVQRAIDGRLSKKDKGQVTSESLLWEEAMELYRQGKSKQEVIEAVQGKAGFNRIANQLYGYGGGPFGDKGLDGGPRYRGDSGVIPKGTGPRSSGQVTVYNKSPFRWE